MAAGTGKTVVMGVLIAYNYYNRAEYRNDVRFADNFLLITPGITIRDRLGFCAWTRVLGSRPRIITMCATWCRTDGATNCRS